MSLAAQIDSDVVDLLLNTDEHAETITHRPLGVAANDVSVTAIVTLSDPRRVETGGSGVERQASLTLDASLAVDARDRWGFRGGWWETRTVSTAAQGIITVGVQQLDEETRRAARSVL